LSWRGSTALALRKLSGPTIWLEEAADGMASGRQRAVQTAFVEPMTPLTTALPECVIELESTGGGKTRIQWKAAEPLGWTSLLRAEREMAG
jgi:hypothetical protein